MSLRIITDTHIAKQIAIQLRDKGVDVVRLEELDALPNNADDEDILAWATENQRAVVSLDDDFEKLHYQWMIDNKVHNGIFLGGSNLQGEKGFGTIIKFLAEYSELVLDMSLLEGDLIPIE